MSTETMERRGIKVRVIDARNDPAFESWILVREAPDGFGTVELLSEEEGMETERLGPSCPTVGCRFSVVGWHVGMSTCYRCASRS